jgi:two-component system sensor histidine kinase BarA
MKNNFEDEILSLLIKMLPAELKNLKSAYDNQEYEELRRLIHKLRGALCYCDAPLLRQAATQLESSLKCNNLNDASTLFKKVESEIDALLKKSETSG